MNDSKKKNLGNKVRSSETDSIDEDIKFNFAIPAGVVINGIKSDNNLLVWVKTNCDDIWKWY